MVGNAKEIYTTLEPLYTDFRRIVFQTKMAAYEIHYIDEFIEKLLTEV